MSILAALGFGAVVHDLVTGYKQEKQDKSTHHNMLWNNLTTARDRFDDYKVIAELEMDMLDSNDPALQSMKSRYIRYCADYQASIRKAENALRAAGFNNF